MKILDLSAEDAHYTKTFTLESVQYLVELRWIDRMSSWYIDVSLVDGTPIARGRRVAPGGVLFATGKDRYAREDLGITGGVNVLYASRAEWDIAYPGTVPELVRITPA